MKLQQYTFFIEEIKSAHSLFVCIGGEIFW